MSVLRNHANPWVDPQWVALQVVICRPMVEPISHVRVWIYLRVRVRRWLPIPGGIPMTLPSTCRPMVEPISHVRVWVYLQVRVRRWLPIPGGIPMTLPSTCRPTVEPISHVRVWVYLRVQVRRWLPIPGGIPVTLPSLDAYCPRHPHHSSLSPLVCHQLDWVHGCE